MLHRKKGIVMKIGYARVSTLDQNLDGQMDALKAAGCERIYTDMASGKNTARPELQKMIDTLREGDTVVVWRLDRLGRSTADLLGLVNGWAEKGVGFQSLSESLDTRGAMGQLMLTVFAAFAEFERNLIRERTLAGLAAARARGRMGGGVRKINNEDKKRIAEMYRSGALTVREIGTQFGVTRQTVYRALAELGVKTGV